MPTFLQRTRRINGPRQCVGVAPDEIHVRCRLSSLLEQVPQLFRSHRGERLTSGAEAACQLGLRCSAVRPVHQLAQLNQLGVHKPRPREHRSKVGVVAKWLCCPVPTKLDSCRPVMYPPNRRSNQEQLASLVATLHEGQPVARVHVVLFWVQQVVVMAPGASEGCRTPSTGRTSRLFFPVFAETL